MRFFILTMVIMFLAQQLQTQESDDKGTTVIVSVKMFEDNKPAQEAQGALTPVASYARVHLVGKIANDTLEPLDPPEFIQIADDKGVIHFKGIPAGDYRLYVDGFSPPQTNLIPIKADAYAVIADIHSFGTAINEEVADGGKITVKGNEKVVDHTIVLYPSTKLKVTVTYDDNTPIKGAKITPHNTKYGLRSFTRIEKGRDKPHTSGYLTDEKGESTIVGFNAELEPTVAIKVEIGEEPLAADLEEGDFNAYRVVRSKVISDIKLSSKEDNSISVKFRRLDRSKVVAKGKLKSSGRLSGQQILAHVTAHIAEEHEYIRLYAGKIDIKDREITCVPDAGTGFSYTLYDIKPGRYAISAILRQVFREKDKRFISEDFYTKCTTIVIEKNKITTFDITLTEQTKHEVPHK